MERSTFAGGRSTHFEFKHKVFAVDGGYFALSHDTKEAVFHIPLGDIKGVLALEVLRSEFKIEPDSHDGKLLGIIDRSLRFVKEIRPNDSIPREILDGTASWTVEPIHRQIARNRLTVQLVAWMAGDERELSNVEQLNALADAPETKEKVQLAFDEIAEKLGVGRGRKKEVVDRIDVVARELAYIEALRARAALAHQIGAGIDTLTRAYTSDKSMLESLERMRQLIKPPLAGFTDTFAQVDAQTGEVLALLKNFQSQITFIRETRDDLHTRLMIWDDIIERWRGFAPKRSETAEDVMRETYRFLAHNFPQNRPWKLGGF
ncbi:MAG TPA: hypothetical protein VFO41_03845 [Alphaproteobacteria bacterium]|nr:hypothetical protein [Alphaproteobacteria bacterium]